MLLVVLGIIIVEVLATETRVTAGLMAWKSAHVSARLTAVCTGLLILGSGSLIVLSLFCV